MSNTVVIRLNYLDSSITYLVIFLWAETLLVRIVWACDLHFRFFGP